MTILIALDESDPAWAALEFALDEHPDEPLLAVYVVDPSVGPYGEGGIYAYDTLVENRREEGQSLLSEAADLAAEYDVDLETELSVGTPPREIVRLADERDVDRIVIGSSGRTGASRVLLGSVAETVTRRASVPVTIVR